VWNYIGFFTYFHFEKQAAQKSFKHKLKLAFPKDELKTFQFSPEESSKLIWHKTNEFQFKEKIYDIVYADTLDDGSFVFTCISDSQETILFEQLSKFVAQDLNSDTHQPIKTWKVNFEKPYEIIELEMLKFHFSDIIEELNFSNNYFFSLQAGELSLETPPPNPISI